YREYTPCARCGGARLNPTALSYRVGGANLAGWHALTVAAALARASSLEPRDPQGRPVRKQLVSRLRSLDAVGPGHLGPRRQARAAAAGACSPPAPPPSSPPATTSSPPRRRRARGAAALRAPGRRARAHACSRCEARVSTT